MAALALEEFVEREEWQIAEIEAAAKEANRGEFARDDEVAAVLSKYAAAPAGR
ncbi:putative transcriptional regulator [Rhizobium sp. OAE497]